MSEQNDPCELVEEDEDLKLMKPSPDDHEWSIAQASEGENGCQSKKSSPVSSPVEKSSATFIDPKCCQPSIRGLKMFFLLFAFVGLGISNVMFGPTLLDLAHHTNSEVAQISYIFTAFSSGYLVGSAAGGWLFDKLHNSYLVLGCAPMGMVVTMIMFPIFKSIIAVMLIAFVMAIFNGMIEAAGNAILFVLYTRNSEPYMQMLHFTYALGAFLAPLLAKPFLLPASVTNSTTNASSNYSPDGIPSVAWAYWLGTIPSLLPGIFFLVCAFYKSQKVDKIIAENVNLPKVSHSDNKVFKNIILVFFFMLVLFYIGIEDTCSGFILTFAVKSRPQMSPDDAALLTSAFWITFACGRLFAVLLTKFLRTHQILFINLVGCLIASVILLSQVHNGCDSNSSAKLWSGIVVLGLSTSSVFPTIFSWVEDFLAVTGRVSALLLVGACVGAMIFTVIVGNTFESIGPCIFLYCVFILSSLCLIFYFAIYLFGRYLKSSNISSRNGIELKKRKLAKESK